ncbi:MAG: DNA polymerase III subunit alpha [Paludibacteraceae bacterium]|nr:DNA polymerase III subunit alpha [Paludibacteraceae bacterium]
MTTNIQQPTRMQFTHLHVHSHYSILDGMSKVPDIVNHCQENGMNAVALTDHGNMYGIKEFLDYCKKINKKASGKVKECEERIQKAEQMLEQLPEWEKQLQTETDEHERETLNTRIKDARKAAEDLPGLREDLPRLKKKAEEYVPFKPIVGVEAYCARRSRHLKEKGFKQITGENREIIVDRSGWHLILLAKNKTGYYNLCKIVSLSFIEGFYDRPRIDKELLEQYHEGIICSSACLGGELPQLILQGKTDEAEKSINWFKSIFGEDYYIELMRHKTDKPNADTDVYQKQMIVNKVLVELARKTNTKIICTNDAHFVKEEHAEAHDRLICLSTGKYLDDQNRMHYTKQEWLKTPEEMAAIFSDLPEALSNTQEIVDKVEVYDIDSAPIMPLFPIPEDFGTEEEYRQRFTHEDLFNEFTRDEKGNVVLSQEEAEKKIKKLGGYDRLYRIKLEADYLSKLTWEGAAKRYPGDALTDEHKERINFELHVMKTMGFPGYFLIVMDYIRAAREELGVSVGPGRGSAAGSVVAYCLRITDLDPLKYDLLFERFLNPDRISLPDIDVDFDDAGRERVLNWVSEKYGKTHVAHIITYGTMAAKSAIADVGRVQRVPLAQVNEIKKLVPDKFPDELKDEKGKTPKVNLHNCYRYVDELKALLNGEDDNVSSMLHYAEELEDTIRQVGIHACGVIIGADDLTKFAPLATIKDRDTGEDIMVTQYDGHVVENVGLIKMDFLGLKTLTIIKEALSNIRHSKGEAAVPDIDNIPIDDPLTYKLFQEGKTIAVFQFESPGMQKHMKNLKPTQIGDLIAMNALYRPGPMDYIDSFIRRKHGREEITYDIPVMEKYLKDTYGITVYQEQVMLLSRLLAGFTRGQADSLRKAMGKKIFAMLADLKPKFIEGGKKNGHNPQVLEKIWKDWEAFASYAFNKSHAACYAWVAYQTAYLKAHFPAEFMAANLTVSKDDITSVTKLMDECRSLGINVLRPDINESELNFTVNQTGDIRFGLGGIKGVGESAVEAILRERAANGKFDSIYNFVERVNLNACNKKAVESMALAGAFDGLEGLYREQLMDINSKGENVLDTLMRYGNQYQLEKDMQQNSLFGGFDSELAVEIQKPELPLVPRRSAIEKLNIEKSLIGIFLSAHPLDEYEFEIRKLCSMTTAELSYFDQFVRPDERSSFITPEDKMPPLDWIEKYENKSVKIGGIITKVEKLISKNNNAYGRFTIEDYTGTYTFVVFGETYQRIAPMMIENLYAAVSGVVQQRGAGRQYFKPALPKDAEYEFSVKSIEQLQGMQEHYLKELRLKVPITNISPDFNEELVDLAKKSAGTASLTLQIFDEQHRNKLTLVSKKYKIKITKDLWHWLQTGESKERFSFEVI